MTSITTDRLRLRPLRLVLPRHPVWLNDPEVVRYSEQRHVRHTAESCAAYLETFDFETSFVWGIVSGFDHIGNITARIDQFNDTADIGILIGERGCWGQGYGAEAWRAVCDYMLTRVRKVEAGTMGCNAGMLRVFHKTGMVIEGHRRAHFMVDGQPVDLTMAARVR